MQNNKTPTSAQLRADASKTRTHSWTPDPAASPLGTDDEAADTTSSADRIEMAREAERKIGDAARRTETLKASADEAGVQAETQRASSSPYAKEDHMNQELAKKVQAERLDQEGVGG